MPRHDASKTPPSKRRAPKGSVAGNPRFSLTRDELAALAHLQQTWDTNGARAVGRALLEAARREGWSPPSEAQDRQVGT
ncbi:hypothetical protein F0U60_37545 [Archangium minus]|uniref:Uncharacterized protein n=1 Tax=Archangium minus TaxID=83450 RepID=A0ABY9X1B1_9BACT|nr:hypothetical protein F0U60_37545 [Archangium minus]